MPGHVGSPNCALGTVLGDVPSTVTVRHKAPSRQLFPDYLGFVCLAF